MATPTTTYAFQKPTVGGDLNTWGAFLNGNFDLLEALLTGAAPLIGPLDLQAVVAPAMSMRSTMASTSAIVRPLYVRTDSSGTPAIGIGTGVSFNVETSSGNVEMLGAIDVAASIVGLGTEKGYMSFSLMNNGAAATEVMRLEPEGMTLKGQVALVVLRKRKITSTGAISMLSAARAVEIDLVAPGGGGGGVDGQGAGTSALGGSGGGGSYQKIFTDVMAQTFTLTAGAVGAGGAAGNNNGGNGGDMVLTMSVDGVATCPGGRGGSGDLASAAANGGFSNGGAGGPAPTQVAKTLLACEGQAATNAFRINNVRVIPSISGGNALFCSNTRNALATDAAGTGGNNHGVGGSGGSVQNVAGNFGGGDGSPGCAYVTEYG
jgi:hypothetical protein